MSSSHPIFRIWLPLALFSVLWIDMIRLLSNTWETREQYGYGWFVPFFAAYLFWRRWMDRPAPCSEVRSQKSEVRSQPTASSFQAPSPDVRCQRSSPASSLQPPASLLLALFIFLLCLSLLPLRVIFEINPDWPLICWVYSISVVGLTIYALYLVGGWSWVRHFAFPVALILVAIAWPWRIENALTQGLMQVVANLTVEILGWLNIPAEQQGNLIALSSGTVGVNEACSGIRSFQSSVMAALVIGELYRLRLLPRIGFLICGPGLAFIFNVIRTLLLSWQADKNGLSAIDKWHDPAGMIITVACFFVLWAVAGLLQSKWGTVGQRAEASGARAEGTVQTSEVSGQRSVVSGPTSGFRSQVSASPTVHRSPFTVHRYLLAVGLWSLLCIGATEIWYRAHEAKASNYVRWSVTLPETKASYQKIEIPPRTLQLLRYDDGMGGKWQETDGSEWSVYFFRWQGKTIQSILSARYHRPEVCLPASGLKQVSDSHTEIIEAAHLKLPCRKSTYSSQGKTLYVFYCLWQDGDERRTIIGSRDATDRLLGPMEGRRRYGQQTLELILSGYSSIDEAERAVRQRLPALIQVKAQTNARSSSSRQGSQGSANKGANVAQNR